MIDSDSIAAMSQAFDRVRAIASSSGRAVELNAISLHLISLARHGERDPERLCEGVLTALGLRPPPVLERKSDECYALATQAHRDAEQCEGEDRQHLIQWEKTWLTLAETFEALSSPHPVDLQQRADEVA